MKLVRNILSQFLITRTGAFLKNFVLFLNLVTCALNWSIGQRSFKMKAVKLLSIFLLVLSLISTAGCRVGEILYEGNTFFAETTSPDVSGAGNILISQWEVRDQDWKGPALKSNQGSVFQSEPTKKLPLDVYSIQAMQLIDTRLLVNFDLPIITVGGWDSTVKFALKGESIPSSWNMEVLPWRKEPSLKKIRFTGNPIAELTGELARLYVISGTQVRVDWGNLDETDFLLRQKIRNVTLFKKETSVYEEKTSISLGQPTNEVKIDFVLTGPQDKLLGVEVGSLFRYGTAVCTPHDPPVLLSGSILVQNWWAQIIYKDGNTQAAPRHANHLFVFKETKAENGSTLLELKGLQSTSQASVVRQWVKGEFLFAKIQLNGGPLMSVKLPTKVVVPAKDIPIIGKGKLPATWGDIKYK